MGRNEYARHRGCAPNAVRKAEDDGRIASAVRRSASGDFIGIDWKLADSLWTQNTDPMEAAKQGKLYEPQAADAAPPDAPVPLVSNEDQHGYLAARGQREKYQAERARLDLLERLGLLLSRDGVRDSVFAAVRQLRDNLFLIGPRISLALAAETDPLRIERVINDEHRKILNELSRALAVRAAGGTAERADAG